MSNSPTPVIEATQQPSPMACGAFTIYPVKVAHAIAEEIACNKPFVKDAGFTMKLVARFFVLTHTHDTAIKAATDLQPEQLQPFMDADATVLAEFVRCYDSLTSNAKKIASTMDSGKNPTKATGR